MKRLVKIIAVAFVLTMAAGAAHAQTQPPSAREVLERTVAALGGRETLNRVRTLAASGKVEARGLTGTYQRWAKAPGKLKTRLDVVIQQLERGFDGREGWERRTSVRELSADENARLRQSAVFIPLLQYLSAGTPVELKGKRQLPGVESYVLQFSPPGETPVVFYLDAQTFLPLREVRGAESAPTKVSYGDYRKVGGLMLPFSVTEETTGQTLSIKFDEYRVDQPLDDAFFENPAGARSGPYEVSLETVPFRVYKENDGVESAGPTESWVFNLLVKEKHGRALEPKSASVELYSGANLVKTVWLGAASLKAARGLSFQGFAQREELFDLRHYFSEPVALGVDRLVYTLDLTTPVGESLRRSLTIPVTAYEQKTKLIFPLKGEFVVAAGHDFNEDHKGEWSQHYAYDIIGLGAHYEIIRSDGETNEDFHGWGREILAPAAGAVVYARDDVEDNPRPGVVRRDVFLKMAEPMWAVAGNSVVIDHGNGEYSVLAHLRKGSVRVKTGDSVKQGQALGLLGNSGNSDAPHLHYQLMAGPVIFRSDGLPSRFSNLEAPVPKRGVFLEAK